jgi:hypothetical protein
MVLRSIAALLIVAFLSLPAWAQSASPAASTGTTYPPALGIPAPSSGAAVDPTKNVLDTVLAAVTRLNDIMAQIVKRQDDLREFETKFQNALREAETRRVNDLRDADIRRSNDLRDAETRRTNELSAQKSIADLELARVNKASVDSSALLLATAVKELKTDSSDRTAKLEQFANEQRGRASGGNEVWALIGVLAMLLLVAVGVLVNMWRKEQAQVHSTLSSHDLDAIISAIATAHRNPPSGPG